MLLILRPKLQTAVLYCWTLRHQNSETCIIQVDPELSPYSREWEVSLVECLLRMSSALMSYPIYFLQQSLKWAAISLWGD